MLSSKSLLAVLALCQGITFASACSKDIECQGVQVCNDGQCGDPLDCGSPLTIVNTTKKLEIRGGPCRVTLDDLMDADGDAVTEDNTVYTLHKKLWIRDGVILEIHGDRNASTQVSELRLKSGDGFASKIVAWHGKISILDTVITSWDEEAGAPDDRPDVEMGRAFIAAISSESADGEHVYESRMDVENSEISFLGNAGDYHNDTDNDYGLVWKVKGYDDRFPEDYDLELFDRVGVYGILKGNKLHHNYMGAYCYGMKGGMTWSHNEVYNNTLNGINPQDNSDDMKIHDNHVYNNGWHGIEYSKRCLGAKVYNNVVEDNARAGIFFHRSTDGAVAYNNTCRRNLEGDFGIVESADVQVYDNVMEGGKYGIRLSLGARNCSVYDNVMTNSSRYGVFTYRGSDEAEASVDWDGRPQDNIIRNNFIADPLELKGVAVKEADNTSILDNTFVGIDTLRFDDSYDTLVTGNSLPEGVEFDLENGATLADGSQSSTDSDDGSDDDSS